MSHNTAIYTFTASKTANLALTTNSSVHGNLYLFNQQTIFNFTTSEFHNLHLHFLFLFGLLFCNATTLLQRVKLTISITLAWFPRFQNFVQAHKFTAGPSGCAV